MCDTEALSKRFTGAVERLTGRFTETSYLGIAVSGGADSVALLLLAHQAYPGKVIAATVDHGFRAEAAGEAAFVAKLCAERNIPHSILKPATPIIGNIQSAARAARYALLDIWATERECDWIATAHHADDQLETVLMRLARGSGVDGLSGIRAANGRIIRPLLGFSKAELIAICQGAGVNPVQDPSNEDRDFDRVRMRQYLATAPHPFQPLAATRSALALSQSSEALDWMTTQLEKERITGSQASISLDASALPRELQRRLLHIALRQIDPDIQPRGDSIDRALEALAASETLTIGNIMCKGGKIWRFCPAPARRNG